MSDNSDLIVMGVVGVAVVALGVGAYMMLYKTEEATPIDVFSSETEPVTLKCDAPNYPQFKTVSYGANEKFITDPTLFNQFCKSKSECIFPAMEYHKIAGDPISGVTKQFKGTYLCGSK